jgi:hypothetical protein
MLILNHCNLLEFSDQIIRSQYILYTINLFPNNITSYMIIWYAYSNVDLNIFKKEIFKCTHLCGLSIMTHD